jgi:lipoyl(octanoyl) transferase
MIASKLSGDPKRLFRDDGRAADWAVSTSPVGYEAAVAAMEARAAAIAAGSGAELVWLLEHPPLYTGGVSARREDLLDPGRFPVHLSGRGGQFTYHGPGQRVVYVMLDLNARGRDVRAFVAALEAWVIDALDTLGVRGEIKPGRIGVWVARASETGDLKEEKIAALGIKLRRWVSFHGLSLNVDPDLDHFSGIVPCGIREHGVTSLKALGVPASLSRADEALAGGFSRRFGARVHAPPPL